MSETSEQPRSCAETARNALRRVLWAIQKLAHSSLPELADEPAEEFGRKLDTWDKLCKNASEAEAALYRKKEEQALSWLERSAQGFDALARPAAAQELAELASAVENAAKVWEKLAREAAREAGTAVWLEHAWGTALGVLASGVGALPADDRKRILEERLSTLHARRQAGKKLLAAAAAAGARPLMRLRLAAFLSLRIRRLKNAFDVLKGRESDRAATALELEREIETLRRDLTQAGARADSVETRAQASDQRAESLDGTVLGLRQQLQESLFQHESFVQQAEAVQARARALQSEGETLRETLEKVRARSASDQDLARESEGRLQAEVNALQELLKQSDEQSASVVGRAIVSENAAAALSREKETPSPVPAEEKTRGKELEAELAAARAECAELRRSLEIAQAELERLGPQAGESALLRTELERGQARLAKLTAEYEAAVGPRLQ